VVAVGVVVASRLGCDEVVALLAGAAAGTLLLQLAGGSKGQPDERADDSPGSAAALLPVGATAGPFGAAATTGAASIAVVPLGNLFLFFFKVGLVFFGGGYVLMAYIQGGLVEQYGFSETQLWDALAIGSLTPGPMLAMVTFVGYLAGGGTAGALAATAGIILPSFVFVVATNPLIPRLRRSRFAGRFLDAVVAASLGLIVAVTFDFMADTLLTRTPERWNVNWLTLLVAAVAVAVNLKWKPAPAWLVLGGAAAGYVLL